MAGPDDHKFIKIAEHPEIKPSEARKFLIETLGKKEGDALYSKLPKTKGYRQSSPFDFLEVFSVKQLDLFFKNESPAAAALVFSRLPTKLTAELMALMEGEKKAELAKRIAKMGETSPEILQQVAAAIREKARNFYRANNTDDDIQVDGMSKLAAILKASDSEFGDRLIGELSQEAPEITVPLREKYYTLDDAALLPDRVIEDKLRSMSDRDIVLLLKNKNDLFKNKVLANLSDGREERITEEETFIGPVLKIETEAVLRDFLAWFRSTGPWIN